MLYVTTRVSGDAFTAYHALTENRGPEGGFYVPLRFPRFDTSQIAELSQRPFAHNVAEILNRFFGTQIDGCEMELGIGKCPVKLIGLNGRITVAKHKVSPIHVNGRSVKPLEKGFHVRQMPIYKISHKTILWLYEDHLKLLFGFQQLKKIIKVNGDQAEIHQSQRKRTDNQCIGSGNNTANSIYHPKPNNRSH